MPQAPEVGGFELAVKTDATAVRTKTAKVRGLAAAGAAVKAMLATLADELAQGEAVWLAGFGTFAAKDRPARTGRNPRTGERFTVPASRRVAFRPRKALRDAANRGSER